MVSPGDGGRVVVGGVVVVVVRGGGVGVVVVRVGGVGGLYLCPPRGLLGGGADRDPGVGSDAPTSPPPGSGWGPRGRGSVVPSRPPPPPRRVPGRDAIKVDGGARRSRRYMHGRASPAPAFPGDQFVWFHLPLGVFPPPEGGRGSGCRGRRGVGGGRHRRGSLFLR